MLRRDLIAAGFDTIGDLLLFFPRDHISYGMSLHSPKRHCSLSQIWAIYKLHYCQQAVRMP